MTASSHLLIFVFLKFKIDGALRAFYGANPRKIRDLLSIVDFFIFKLFSAMLLMSVVFALNASYAQF